MKIQKRIKQIVSLTVDDFYGSGGYSSSDTPKQLKAWLTEDILNTDSIEDLYTHQISILILEKLKALDIVDLGFIIELVCDTKKSSDTGITFDKVVI